ncbi:Prefoldin beta-like protein [Neoconidiobolus thromboides FSU 785]|nr:Prefoldin beta-like protein [Neoconidiobolus thromboides FSU 785]
MAALPKLTEKEIVVKFNQLKQEISTITSRIGELESEIEEHKLVIETMEPLSGDRKCFRLIGGVLVERTVKEILPTLKANHDGIAKLIESLVKNYKAKDEEFKKFQQDYKVRIAPAQS